MRHLTMFCVSLFCLGMPAFAQDDAAALAERLDRLERDVSFVQKQVYRSSGGEGNAGVPVNNGQALVRFTQIDEEIRQIRGLIEQMQYQNRQTATELKKLSEDVDYRLRAMEQKQAEAPQAAVAAPAPASEQVGTEDKTEEAKPASYKPESKEKQALTGNDFPDANAHYSHAFKLLNDKKFSDAAASFDAFVKKYPSDPLTSNAYYWLGESQYVRRDYTRSAESFRKGFESNPEGQKAPDNLYKLAMSLNQVKRTTEACVVLKKVLEKYSETAARTAVKAQEARANLQCK